MNSHKRHIILLSHSAALSGSEKSLLEKADYLNSNQYKVTVIAPREGPFTQALQALDIDYITMWYPWTMHSDPRRHIRSFHLRHKLNQIAGLRLARYKQLQTPHSVLLSNCIVTTVGKALATILKIPHAWLAHELPTQFESNASMNSYLVQTKDQIISNSSFTYGELRKSGIPAEQLLSRPLQPILKTVKEKTKLKLPPIPAHNAHLNLANIGAIKPQKNQLTTAKIATELAAYYETVTLHLVGQKDESYLNQIQKAVKTNRNNVFIKYINWSSDPFNELPEDSIVIQTPIHETYGRIIPESILSGLIVFGLDSGATKEVLSSVHGHDFIVGDPDSAPAQVASKIIEKLKNSERKTLISKFNQIHQNTIKLSSNPADLEQILDKLFI